MNTKTPRRRTARDRLLATVDELFYSEGIHTVGIDRVIEEAGVAKGSLYYSFGGKEELVAAYLEGRHQRRKARIDVALAGLDDPVEKILAVFDVLHDIVTTPGYRGCAFANAVAEAKPGAVEVEATERYRRWLRDLLAGLATEAGFTDPEGLTERLTLLYDGAVANSQLDKHPQAALVAKELAQLLLSAADRT